MNNINNNNSSSSSCMNNHQKQKQLGSEDNELASNLRSQLYIVDDNDRSNHSHKRNVNSNDNRSSSSSVGPPGFRNEQQMRSKSFNKLAEAVGEGLANTMDAPDDIAGGGGFVGSAQSLMGLNLAGDLFNGGSTVGCEMNNFQRQSRHAASRLKGKATGLNYSNLEHHHPNLESYGRESSSSQNVALNSQNINGLMASVNAGGSVGDSTTAFSNSSVSLKGTKMTYQMDLNHSLNHNNTLGIDSSKINSSIYAESHPQVGLCVNEPVFNSYIENRSGLSSLNSNEISGSGALASNMDKGILDYMHMRDFSLRGSGTGSAPPDFDKEPSDILLQQQDQQIHLKKHSSSGGRNGASTYNANQTTEAQLAPFLRNPGPDVKPGRCLAILLHCKPSVEKMIRSVCESFGGLEYFRSEFAVSKGVIFLQYFNLQHAQNAAQYLASRLLLSQTLVEPRIRYCTEISGTDETRLLISIDHEYYSGNNQNASLDETVLSQILSSYGSIRNFNYQVFPGGEECFAVEFYDVMDAKQALLELQTMSHPNLPPIKIQVAGLSPKERKLAKDLLQVISMWRSGSETAYPLTEQRHQQQMRPIPQTINAHPISGNRGAVAQVSVCSHPNSRAQSPASMSTMHSPVIFPPTPPRTPPLIVQQHGTATPHSVHSPVTVPFSGGVAIPNQQQQQPQAHLIVAPDGQISYYMCATNPGYGNAQQIYMQPNAGGYYSGNASPHHSPRSSPNPHGDYFSRRPNQRNSRNNNNDDSNLQLNFQMINSGQDTRTSLMVKNIPNKYTRTMLLDELKENGFDSQKIDFFYLPIDFKNRCNRGYAFVNFVDYRDIVPFWEHYHGQHWRIFNSDKICDITYARIQGKASMLKRFEHSALMEKDEDYQPLVFVSSGPNKGQREVFPASVGGSN